MKKKVDLLLTSVVCMTLVLLSACRQVAPVETAGAGTLTWQEQYDLGVRYLSEGNYEEAIIAFTAAIDIDPKQPETYLGLANAYIGAGDQDAARKALEAGINVVADPAALEALLQTLKMDGPDEDSHMEEFEYYEDGTLKRQNYYDADGKLESYRLYVESGEPGVERIDNYLADGTFTGYNLYYESEDGLSSYSEGFDTEGNSTGKSVSVSDVDGRWMYSAGLNEDGSEWSRNEAVYNDNGDNIGWDTFIDGQFRSYARYENGTTIYYNADGTVSGYGGAE